MSRLLHIEASPRGARSRSSQLATRLTAGLKSRLPGLELDLVNVWREELPPLDGDLIAAKYARLAGTALAPREAQAWASVEAMVRRLDAADRIVISSPLWNFSIPYRLKHYIDLVTQPGLTFSFDPKTGYRPLLRTRPVDIILASAGDYRFGPSWGRPDLATPYLREALAFIGLRDVRVIPVGPTVGEEADVSAAVARAVAALDLALQEA
ncbi:MAG: NAD(P)H-dependent oxidoreductase [Acetobacteraceae bacterium]|nr:NAD(P)H-dependent oxidoreductase [Acetobacteraceae bacterium]